MDPESDVHRMAGQSEVMAGQGTQQQQLANANSSNSSACSHA
jgi:hypothetical protein